MSHNSCSVCTSCFFGDDLLALEFPDKWNVTVCKMAGHDAPPLTDEEIREKLANPIGTKRLSELAKNRKEAVILVDDITRPTKAHNLLPFVLEELYKGGISDDHIRVVIGTGTHGPLSLDHIVRKVGREIVEKIPVYNHNPWENTVFIGRTTRGTPVSINREVMECDLKIAVSSIEGHPMAGFTGGAKMIIPGVSSVDTIYANHRLMALGTSGTGKVNNNALRLDMEEAARMAGLDFIVNVVVNGTCDSIDIFCGDVVAALREGAKRARAVYSTKIEKDGDIVVSNAYPNEEEAFGAIRIANQSVKEGGEIVILDYCPPGMVLHYLYGRWGSKYGGRLFRWPPRVRSNKAIRIIVVNPYPNKADEWRFGPSEQVVVVKSWNEALDKLKSVHGESAKVVVFPCAMIQDSEEELHRK
jgi:nickel-dependent lactate racemase